MPDNHWKLWVRYTTGGVAYRPSFPAMFLDPMFLTDMEIGPWDHPYNFSLIPGSVPVAAPPVPGGPGNGPPIIADVPVDLPWIPSTQAKSGVRTLMPGSAPTFSVVVLNDRVDWPESTRENIRKALEAGKGLVLIHNALGDNQDWTWWREEVTGGLLVLRDGAGLKKSTITSPVTIEARPVRSHPIVQDIGPLRLPGEAAYRGMWQSSKITPLLEASGQGTDKTVAWIGPNERAHVVCIQPGAAAETHRNVAFRKLVRNAILWAGGRLG